MHHLPHESSLLNITRGTERGPEVGQGLPAFCSQSAQHSGAFDQQRASPILPYKQADDATYCIILFSDPRLGMMQSGGYTFRVSAPKLRQSAGAVSNTTAS